MLICNYEKVTDNNDGLILQDSKMLKDDTWSLKQFWQYYYFDDLRAFCCVAWNKLYKKDLFDNVRTCLVSFKNYLQEGQYNHLKTAVKGAFTVFPKSPTFV